MDLLTADAVTTAELDKVDSVIAQLPADSRLAETLKAVSSGVRSGEDVVVTVGKELTPSQAAKILKLSRVHLYKLMDGGALPFVRVGRDRRLKAIAVVRYEEERQTQQLELAERFAHADRDRARLIDAAVAARATERACAS